MTTPNDTRVAATEQDRETARAIAGKHLMGTEAALAPLTNAIIAALAAARAQGQEQIHYANGVADLAMKHRDAAEADAAKLAANQCHEGYGDEYGNHRCHIEDRLRAAEAALKTAREAAKPFINRPLMCISDRIVMQLGPKETFIRADRDEQDKLRDALAPHALETERDRT